MREVKLPAYILEIQDKPLREITDEDLEKVEEVADDFEDEASYLRSFVKYTRMYRDDG